MILIIRKKLLVFFGAIWVRTQMLGSYLGSTDVNIIDECIVLPEPDSISCSEE
jgi:hypothetical protein